MSDPAGTLPSKAAPLGYAQPPPLHRRRALRRFAGVVALALIVASGYWWGPPVARRWSMLSEQRQCLRYDPPAGGVIFTQDADQTFETKPWTRFRSTSQYAIPRVWSQFQARLGTAGRQSHGVVFLHERTSPGGNRRLVVLDLSTSWFKDGTNLSIDKAVARPATWRSDPVWVPPKQGLADTALTDDNAARQSVLTAGYGQSLTILPGRPDPSDGSRFTIDFRVGDQAGTIDGRLHDDDTVTLQVRDAPPRGSPMLPALLPSRPPATARHTPE